MIEQENHQIIEFWKGKRVLITGGTRGLGNALMKNLFEKGAKVTIVARSAEDLESMRDMGIYTIPADLSKKEDIHKISGQAVGMMEGIDVLINNASYLGKTPLKKLVDTDCEDLEEVLQTNLLGPFRLIKAILPYMRFHGSGLIVNISSDAAINPYPTWGGYSISKAGLDHMTAIWREELTDEKIELISVDPGDMHTKMHLDAIPGADISQLYDPTEVAQDLIRFLALSDFQQSRYSASNWRNDVK